MSAETVTNKIEEKARATAEAIIAEAKEKAAADSALTTALNNLLVIVENYPDLKASANFTQLSDELAGTENRIATARRDYNNAVQSYNTAIRKFPTSLVAGLFGFTQKDYFQASDSAQNVPNVEF